MNRAEEILNGLRRRGLSVSMEGSNIRVSPKSLLSDDDRNGLRHHKQEVLGKLQAEAAEITRRIGVMRLQLPSNGPIPFLTLGGDLPEIPGSCPSCGASLREPERYRCYLCAEAARGALRARGPPTPL